MLYEDILTKCPPLVTRPTSPQNALTRRTRTPPDLKWLLNERAALSGAVETSVVRQGLLTARLQRAERQCTKLAATLAGSERALGRSRAAIDALDATIRMAYAEVEPSAGGVVKAWAGKYGKRGGLREYLAQVVRDAAPTPVTLALAINLAAHRFGLVFAIPEDRQRFRYSVRKTLRTLAKDGLIEAVHGSNGRMSTAAWRWTQLPTIAELAAQAAAVLAATKEDTNDGRPHSADSHPS